MTKDTDIKTVKILSHYKILIDEAIEDRLNGYYKDYKKKSVSQNSLEAIELLARFSNGPGKRIRGALAWHTYNQMSDKPLESVGADLAVALELIQDYLLIIDDVMDCSAFRRGLPTVHELYLTQLNSVSKSKRLHLANMLAVSVGSLAQHLANDLVLNCGETDDRIRQTLKALHKNIIITCYGQIDDLIAGNGKTMPSQQTVHNVYEAKSSYYTFINPIQMGMALAGGNDKELLNTVVEFGLSAGLAFQLQDDILGMFGDSRTTGKPNMDDLREGKRTLLILYAMKMSKPAEQAVIKKQLGNPKLTEDEFKKVKLIIEKCGAKDRVENEAKLAAKKAIKVIESSQLPQELRGFYSEIVKYSVERKW